MSGHRKGEAVPAHVAFLQLDWGPSKPTYSSEADIRMSLVTPAEGILLFILYAVTNGMGLLPSLPCLLYRAISGSAARGRWVGVDLPKDSGIGQKGVDS